MATKKTPKKTSKAPRIIGPGDYVLTRSYDAGVYAGTVARISDDGTRVDLVGARHCWSWSGDRLTVDDVARLGARSADRWSGTVEATTQADVCSIILATPEARATIEAAPISVRS